MLSVAASEEYFRDLGPLDGGAYMLIVEVRQGGASAAGAVQVEVVRD